MKRVLFAALPAAALIAAISSPSMPVKAAGPSPAPASFAMCASCHATTASGPAKMGPHLAKIYNRKAGAVAGYAYSPALKKSGIVWDTEKLDEWLETPRSMVPGNRMPFGGIKDAKKRAELIAYMKTL